jgi:hypothetical protein
MGGMIVPRFWAEGRLREKLGKRQITVRRWGWSDQSQEQAQVHAEARTREALDRILSGEKLASREGRVAYNGAEGVPIREEILGQHGETIITRNSYGAHCLNSPDVLFADIDLDVAKFPSGLIAFWTMVCAAAAVALAPRHRVVVGCVALLLTLLLLTLLWKIYRRCTQAIEAKPDVRAHERIVQAMAARPGWNARIYRSPAGFRVLVVHQRFDPRSSEVEQFFRDLGSDPLYVRMCLKQHCFRARVSPKPWRIGIKSHLRPRPGVWPIRPMRMPDRKKWVAAYEAAAQSYASCRYLESLGNGTEDPKVSQVRALHDELSRALSSLPIA